MKWIHMAVLGLAVAAALPATAMAQAPAPTAQGVKPKAKPKVKETEADLMKEAKISVEAATATALKRVPGSAVKSHEIEREGGKLIWTFDLKVAGKKGIEEVNVDAITGELVGKPEHEADPAPKKKP